MPKREPDPADPMTRTGVEIPADLEEVEEMARAFAEEFAAMGWNEARLAKMFESPYFAGPHLAWRQLGEERIHILITEAVRPWRNSHA